MRLREASYADLEAITWVLLASFPNDPQWPYRFQWALVYPSEHRKHTRQRLSEYLDDSIKGVNKILVIEAPSNEDARIRKVIAFATYKLPGHLRKLPPKDNFTRLDANPSRQKAFRRASQEAALMLYDKYGEQQLKLVQLATHPDYWRRGAATKLVQWGMERARTEHLGITMLASPMGSSLYSKLGFTSCGTVTMHVPGEEEQLEYTAMNWGGEKTMEKEGKGRESTCSEGLSRCSG